MSTAMALAMSVGVLVLFPRGSALCDAEVPLEVADEREYRMAAELSGSQLHACGEPALDHGDVQAGGYPFHHAVDLH